jgi:hypothetical protein
VTLTATLTNASDTITWALLGAGSLSATTGTTVSYTPPASVASVTTATLTASAAGATNSVTVTVNPASPPPITITVTGPTSVAAGGAPVTFTATLSSASATITWSLAGPGSLSSTTGSQTSYTPPATTSQGTSATLTASATGAAPGTLTVTITTSTTITVSGTVMLYTSQFPADGVTVVIPGKPAAITDASGTFSISGVTTPYDCTALDLQGKVSTTYLGLTRSDPTLQIFDLIEPRSGTINGSVTPFTATLLPPLVVFGSPDGATALAGGAEAGDPVPDRYDYELIPGWSGPTTTTGTLHALQWMEGNDGQPATYTGYASQAGVEVPNFGMAWAPTLALAPVGTSTLTGSITAFQGAVLRSKVVEVHFKTGGLLPIVTDLTTPLTFSYATPSLASSVAAIDVTAAATLGSTQDTSFVYGRGLSPDGSAQFTLRGPPLASAPANGATGVGLTTDFSWSAFSGVGGGVHVLVTQGVGNAPWYYVVTSGTTARIPDLSAHGMPLPPSTDYGWQVRAYAPFTSVDAFAAPGEPLERSQQHGLSAPRQFRTQ